MKRCIISMGIVFAMSISVTSQAAVQTFLDLTSWQNAVNVVTNDVRLIDFSGFVHGTEIGGAEIGPGVIFREYEGLGFYPRVDNDSAYGGGWLVNRNNSGFDEFEDGFVFDFTEPVIAVSLNDNPGESNRLRIYDAADQLIGEISNGTGTNFLGIISDTPIAYASVINLPPEDGIFAMDNLRIGIQTIPEPASLSIFGLAGLMFVRRRR